MEKVHIKDVGGFDELEINFMPGWSTGPEDGPWQNGLSIDLKTKNPSRWKKDTWSGGVIKKEQAIALAHAILDHYNDD